MTHEVGTEYFEFHSVYISLLMINGYMDGYITYNNRANIGIFCEITKYLPEKMQFFYEFVRKSPF
jgi:hypothetical protein